eukprot:2790304-Pleurochrysis_carterae.AAC.7
MRAWQANACVAHWAALRWESLLPYVPFYESKYACQDDVKACDRNLSTARIPLLALPCRSRGRRHNNLFAASEVLYFVRKQSAQSCPCAELPGAKRGPMLPDGCSQAAARIVGPFVSFALYEVSMSASRSPGCLPFLAAGLLALVTSVLPLLLPKDPSLIKQARGKEH